MRVSKRQRWGEGSCTTFKAPDSRPGYWTQLETESFGIFLKGLETISRSRNICEHPTMLLGCSYWERGFTATWELRNIPRKSICTLRHLVKFCHLVGVFTYSKYTLPFPSLL